MKPNLMHRIGHNGCHGAQCAPHGWNDVPNVTGDYDLDATILHRHDKDLPNRLKMYVKRSSYGKRTGYSGYRGTDD